MADKAIKIGIFGAGRGSAFYNSIAACGGEIVAVCDLSEANIKKARDRIGAGLAVYSDFDEFIRHDGLEAVVLSNYFHEHAPYAIRALELSIHVLSECTSNSTMAEGVALVRAAERSSAVYMLAENYPYMSFNREMRRVYKEGTLGKVLYAEGEYNHPLDPEDAETEAQLCPSSTHWRYQLPRTYYVTHSLAPLVYITGASPIRVTAMPVYSPTDLPHNGISRGVPEKAAVITCLNDDESVYRLTGCAAFGAHECSYRVCAEKGQIENLRDGTGRVLLCYNEWETPEGVAAPRSCYLPAQKDKDAALAKKAGHGGGDFFVIREFLSCIREQRQPEFDVYFATRMASVAILGHRSMLENGVPYDIPDFRNEEDRARFEKDTLTPFFASDGSAPTIIGSNRSYYWSSDEGMASYDASIAKYRESKES